MKTKLSRNSPAEEARINRGIAQDPDNPELDDDFWADAKPASEGMPAELYGRLTRRRGPGKKTPKVQLTMRIDRDLVERLRATGRGWQTRANDALRKGLE